MALGLFTSKSPTQDHTLANLAGPECEHEIVHGAKVLEVTVVSAVLLRWLMERPVSLERLASLVSFCFIIAKTVVAESPGAAVTPTVGGSSAQLQVFCVPCDSGKGTSAAGQCSRLGTPCFYSEPPVIISTGDSSPGDIILTATC